MEAETPSWHPERQCTATSRSGERCQRQPIPGGTVCSAHGGRAPQTIAAAKLRLLEGVEPAIARLLRFIESPPGLCDVCGRCDDTSAIVGAIRTLLDRAGLGPTAMMQVTTAPTHDLSHLSQGELAEHAEATVTRVQRQLDLLRRSREDDAPRLLPEAINAEEGFLIGEPDDPAWSSPEGDVTIPADTPKKVKETGDE
jgi:hypothetical protein